MKSTISTAKVGLIALLVLSSQALTFGQKSKEIVYISEMKEDPKGLSLLSLEIPIWHLFGSKINTSFYDLKTSFSYVGTGKVNGGATFNMRLGDRTTPGTYERTDYVYQNMVMSQYETAPAQSFEMWGAYFFTEKMKKKQVAITVEKVGNIIYYTNVDANQLTKIGLNLGYKQGFTWYNMNNTPMLVSAPETPTVTESVSFGSMSTVQNYKLLKTGITITQATNVKVTLEEYGERKSDNLVVNSFNVLFALQNDFENVLVGRTDNNANELEFLPFNFSEDNKRLPIGFEFTRKIYGKSLFTYEYGIGYYPGLMKNFNLGVNFGVSLNFDFLRKNNTF